MQSTLSHKSFVNRIGSTNLVAAFVLFLTACGSGDDPVTYSSDPALRAFVASRTVDYSAGNIERIKIESDGERYDGSYNSTESDISVAVDSTHIYQVGKSKLDSITKYDANNLNQLVYQRSVAGEDAFANPYQIVFVDITTAYLIRYGSDKIWKIDPSATSEADFKTGELDLSAYNDADGGVAEASAARLVGDRLFVMMERLNPSFEPIEQGYIAVFDLTKGEEIDTGMGAADGLKGIPLGVTNPTALQQPTSDGLLYVVGRGFYWTESTDVGDRFTGGIVSINPETFEVLSVLEDGDEQNNEGFIVNALMTSDTDAYVVFYQGIGSTTLRKLNLASGELSTSAIADLSGVDITTLAKGPKDRLWVGRDGKAKNGVEGVPGFQLINLADDTVAVDLVPTALIPLNVVFLDTRNGAVDQ